MTRKEKGYYYIDSHSGAGMYALADEYAQKTGEYKNGIAKLIKQTDIPDSLERYIEIILSFNETGCFDYYPGSPAIAKYFSRRQDSAHLFELHPSDNKLLAEYCQRWQKCHVKQTDGYQGLLSLLPPPCRRSVVLIDPPYELKQDYQQAVTTLIKAYKKFATGTYIIWYPVVKRHLIDEMQASLVSSQLKNLIKVEYCQSPDTEAYGMTGSGLFIVNPPWQLAEQMKEVLPYLKQHLGNSDSSYVVTTLIKE